MAEFEIALESTLRKEDSTLAGTITNDTGGPTRFGISQNANPECFPELLTCSRERALDIAADIYRRKYWLFDRVDSQLVACKIFDMAVNMGVGTSVRLAQRCCGVPADGAWGPITCAAVNRMPPLQMLDQLRVKAKEHYQEIYDSNPAKYETWIDGWLARAKS